MHLYLRAIIYMGKITRGIYCFYLYDLEMLYTPDTILIALEDPGPPSRGTPHAGLVTIITSPLPPPELACWPFSAWQLVSACILTL